MLFVTFEHINTTQFLGNYIDLCSIIQHKVWNYNFFQYKTLKR